MRVLVDKVDVVIPTRNLRHIRPELLKAIKREPMFNKLIITEEKPLSVARKNACLKAETEWVAMFDDDIIIPACWFDLVVKHIDENVGAISTVADSTDPNLRAYQFVVNSIFPLENVNTSPHINNILIRKKLMQTYNPPLLFLSEDFFLRRHIQNSGYTWKTIGRIGVIHTGSPSKSKVNIGMAYKRFEHYNLYQIIRRFLARLLLAPFAVFLTCDTRTLLNLWRDNVEFFAGWLKEAIK